MKWRRYAPVGARRAEASREMNKLRKKGRDIQPIEIEGRAIARSFWGKRWCEHLESFSDYANRLPHGRTCVRNGSVCHLAIRTDRIPRRAHSPEGRFRSEAKIRQQSLHMKRVNLTSSSSFTPLCS